MNDYKIKNMWNKTESVTGASNYRSDKFEGFISILLTGMSRPLTVWILLFF